MKIQVLGTGCPSCETLYKRVSEVANKINPELEVEYYTDIKKIIELGVMTSPVFVIDEKVITTGKVPDEEEIKEAILENLNK